MTKYLSFIILSLAVIFQTFPVSAYTQSEDIRVAGTIIRVADMDLSVQATAQDPYYRQQWYLSDLKIPSAWDITTGSSIAVAVVDTGINDSHPDLSSRLWTNPREVAGNGQDDDGNGYIDDVHGYNFIDDSADLTDEHGHGTGIASVIAARTNNQKGIAGVDQKARIMVLKALNEIGGGEFNDIVEAVRYAADNGAKVINMSFGASAGDRDLRSAIDYAISKNVIIVAASGNAGEDRIFYPAAYKSVISVGSIDDSDRHSDFSNYGSGLDVVAPGEEIIMADLDDGFMEAAGSSFASALVSGIACLAVAVNPSLTQSQFTELLHTTSHKIGSKSPSDKYGYGKPDALQILESLRGSLTTRFSPATPAIANGTNVSWVEATVLDQLNNPQPNIPITVEVSGHANLVNSSLYKSPMYVGTTDYLGKIRFSLSTTFPELKNISLSSTTGTIQGQGQVSFTPAPAGSYQMKWIAQSPYLTLQPDETKSVWVEVQNTGTATWLATDGEDYYGRILLGTDYGMDRSSDFRSPSWLSPNRVATMEPSVVRPGERAKFVFTITATDRVGLAREYFRPVVEYVGWLNDLGIYWEFTVSDLSTQAFIKSRN